MAGSIDPVEFEKFKHDLQLSVEKFRSEMALINEEARERWVREREAWLGQQRFALESNQAMFRGVMIFAEVTIKGLLLMNGGALIALLALLGGLWTRNDAKGAQIASVIGPSIGYFVAGVSCAVLCAGMSYLAQVFFVENPQVGKKRWKRAGEWFRTAAILLGFGSCGTFLAGAVIGAKALGG